MRRISSKSSNKPLRTPPHHTPPPPAAVRNHKPIMASPATADAPNGISTPANPAGGSGQPASTPPSSSAANATTTPTTADANAAATTATAPAANATAAPSSTPIQPSTSNTDSGLGKRPRDARLLHMVLAHLGVTAYQERVPLQLMDFAYRYTAGVLSDAVAISAETIAATGGKGSAPGNPARGADENNVSLPAIRSAIASRLNYQFNPVLPKEFLLELAQEKNRVSLPRPEREYGVRLPPERYCFTGAGWSLKEEWESEVEDSGEREAASDGVNGGDRMEGVRTEGMDEDEEDDFEEVMGVGGEDREMMDA